MVIIDTSIIIDHLRQSGKKQTILMKTVSSIAKETLGISVITIQELFEGTSTKEEEKEEYILATIAPLKILSYTYEIAQLAGEIARDRKELIEFADAAIASTAIVNGAQLLTLNRKDFEDIRELELFSFQEN